MTYEEQHEALERYLLHKFQIKDWHGVSDAANDLRVFEAQQEMRQKLEQNESGAPHA